MRSALLLFGFVTALASALANGQGRPTLTVADLRCEYLESPLGIDVAEPRLSWRLESTDPAARNQHQSAYRILVASDPDRLAQCEADLWDSGDVKSDQSVHVPYGGKALGSRARCWWKVQVRNEAGRESAWSEPALWTMGLLKPEDWGGAKWIGLDGGEDGIPLTDFRTASWVWYPEGNPAADAPAGTRYFRRTFDLPRHTRAARAECFVAADDAATVFLNGKHIATAAGHPNLVRVELPGSALRGGTNVIAVAATNGAAPVPANPAGLICCLRVEFDAESGKPRVMATDDGWRASDREVGNWNEPAFDDAAWVNAKSLGPIGIAPWGDPYGEVIKSEHRRLPARMLRRGFRATREVRRATATVCGLGFYELYLNGTKVGDRLMEPGLTEYTKRCLYATYDVTNRVTSGDNAVGVILGNGRFFAPRLSVPVPTVTYGYPKMLLNLQIEYADGFVQDLVSDESWTVTADGPIRASNEYDGEEYDAQRRQDGWSSAGFDAAHWEAAQLAQPPGGAVQAQMIEPVRVTDVLDPVTITEPKPGVFVADFGQAFYGVPELTVRTSNVGQRIEMRSSFSVRADGMLNVDNDRTARNTDAYIARGDGTPGETWSPRFKGNAIRRVQVTGFAGQLKPENIRGLVVHTDHPEAGEFSCSNDLINRIYLNARWGTRLQNRSIPMEPDRDERQGWSGHPAKTSESEGYCFNVAPFYASWLHSVRLDQHADGALQEISPGYWTFASKGTIWPAIITIIPNWLHDFYGDTRALADNYDAMRKWVEYHERTNQKPDGTVDHASYGDWVDASWIGRPGFDQTKGVSMPFVSTAYHYNNARLVARAAKLLGKADDQSRFETLAAKVKAGFNARFFDPAADKYDIGNQFSYVLPLAFGLVPEDHRQRVIDNFVEQVMVADKGHTTVGLLGMQWQMQVLTDIGHPEVAYSIATRTDRPSWGYMISKGATTIWERWDTDTQDGGMNGESQKILSGNFEAWCYQTLAGINYDPARPGFKHVILRPHPVGDLTWVKASHKSMYGTISSEWKIADGGAFRWDVTVPPNTTATVHVPWGAVHEVGSGAYTFESRKP